MLERLSDARRNGHRVLAVVRGSAVNQDGASQRADRAQWALAAAGDRAGAGECEAVGGGRRRGGGARDGYDARGSDRGAGPDGDYGRIGGGAAVVVGSVKSNIGHTQAAAGVGGVIKMVLALGHGVLPRRCTRRSLAARRLVKGTVRLLSEAGAWARNGRLRRAGVSSFGVSGTNAHVILEEAGPAEPADSAAAGSEAGGVSAGALCGGALPFVLVGQGRSGLAAQARRLAALLEGALSWRGRRWYSLARRAAV